MFVDTQETSFLHDLTKPSLEALSHILRHKEMWPEGFKWNFGDCQSCAMGLAHKMWLEINSPSSYRMAEHMGITERDACDLFVEASWNADWNSDKYNFDITPEMVADQIDLYLAAK
jgi:hypothetical protein